MAPRVFAVLVLALVSTASAARVGYVAPLALSEDSTCTACLVATRIMSDLLCDPASGDFLLDVAVKQVCPALGADKAQCTEFAVALIPVAIQWLRASATPAAMCAAVGVCAGEAALADPEINRARFRYHDSADCPLCHFVVARTADALAAPVRNDVTSIRTAAHQACAALPVELQSACGEMVATHANLFAAFLGKMDTPEVCAASGVCNAGWMAIRPAPLPRALVTVLSTLQDLHHSGLGAGSSCDTCKMTVLEMHMLITNPTIQEDIRVYVKTLCVNMFPNSVDTCSSYVDLYSPLVFQQLDTYIQPDPICQGIHMCPVPTKLQSLAEALLPHLGAFLPLWAKHPIQ